MNRLRLNPAKTHVIWLGSKQQVDRVDVLDVPILGTSGQCARLGRCRRQSPDDGTACECRVLSGLLPTSAVASGDTLAVF